MRIFGAVICAALALAMTATRAEAGFIFASTAAGAPGNLYVLDSATGALVQNVGPLNDASTVNYPITGLAFHPTTGVLYGSTGNAGSVDALLVTINPATALVTVIGPFNAGPTNSSGVPTTMADLEFDSAGTLYGVASIGGPNVYSINPATGQATLVGPNGVSTSTSGGGLAITSAGTAYGTPTASRFGTYNLATGAYTDIGNPAKPAGGGAYGSLTVSETGVIYGLNVGPGAPPPTALVTINPANAGVTLVGNTLPSLDAIAYQIPEPGGATLLLLAAAAIARRGRRG